MTDRTASDRLLQVAGGATIGLSVGGGARLVFEIARAAGATAPVTLTDFQIQGIVFTVVIMSIVGPLIYPIYRRVMPGIRADMRALAWAPAKPPPQVVRRMRDLRPAAPMLVTAAAASVITAVAAGSLVGAAVAIIGSVVARVGLVLWAYGQERASTT